MEKTRDKFNLKRVKMAFMTVLALVALAGVLQVVLAVLSLADAEVMSDAEAGSDGAAMDKGLLGDIVLDGGAISADAVDVLAVEKRDFTSYVEFIDQYEVLPAGCEIMSLTVVLRSMGYDVDPLELADNYVDMSGVFPTGFSGSPYTNGAGCPRASSLPAKRGSASTQKGITPTIRPDRLSMRWLPWSRGDIRFRYGLPKEWWLHLT